MSDRGELTRDILLRIRAQNLSTADFNAVSAAVRRLTSDLDQHVETAIKAGNRERELSNELKRLEQAAKGLEQISRLIDNYKAFESVLARSEARVNAARQKLEEYRAKIEQTNDSSARAERTLATLVKRLEAEEAQLASNRQTHEANAAAIRKAGFDVNDLAEAENRLKAAADQAGAGITKLSTAVLDYSKNARVAKEEAQNLARSMAAQEAQQLRQFQAFREQQKKSIADQESEQLRQFQAFRERQREETAARQAAADKERALREAEAKAGRDAVERFRKLRQEAAAVQQQTIVPLPGTGPRTDAMGRPGRGASAPVSFLGLRPYELTNLGYQINDVISGLVSGQNATQVLAQQGGQFIQIFGTAALRWFPAVAAAATAVGVAIGALTRSLREASSNREFEASLRVNANAANYTATQLTALRKEIRDMAVSWQDAGNVIRQAVAANIRPELIRDFAQLAKDISRVNGVEVPEAMQQLVKGLTGGRQAIEDLISAYPVLRDEQIKHVRDLLAEGKQGEAQTTVLRALAQAYREAAEKGTSPLSKATEELSKKWDDLLIRLGKSRVFNDLVGSITGVVEALGKAVDAADRLAARMDDPRFQAILRVLGFSLNPVGFVGGTIGRGIGSQLGGAPVVATASIPESRFDNPRGLKLDTETLQQLARIITEASKSLPEGYRVQAISTERPGAIVAGTNTPSEHGFGRAIDVRIVDSNGRPVAGAMGGGGPLYELLDRAVEAAAGQIAPGVPLAIGSRFRRRPDAGHYSLGGPEAQRQAGAGVQQGATTEQNIAADRLIRAEQERLEVMRAQSEAAEEEVIRRQALARIQEETTDKAKQDAYVQAQVEQFRYERQKDRYREEQEQARQRIQDGKDFAAIEEAGAKARADAVKQGITDYKTLRDVQRQGEAEERSRLQRIRQESDQLDAIRKRLSELSRSNSLKETSALERALEAVNIQYDNELKNLEKIAERSTTLRSEDVEKLKQQLELERQRAIAKATVASYETQARESLSTRQQLIQTYSNLEAAGEISIGEREKKIKEAFDLTSPAIREAADQLERFLQTAEGLSLPPEKIALLTARIQELRSETKYVDPFFKGLRDTIKNSFSTGLDTAFNTVAEAIGGVIAKTKEWKDVFTSVKNAALSLFSQLLKDIASYIIKAEAAKLASSLFGGSGGSGGGVFGFLGSLFGGGGGTGAASATTAATSAASQVGSVGFSIFHGGGVAGRDMVPERRIPVAPSFFEHAPRYHRGTVVGLGPRERAAIVEDGEEILSRDNPRNVLNAMRKGSGRGGDVAIRAVLVDDRERVPEAMAGASGERVVIQHLVRNAATIRQIVNDG